MTVVGGWFQGKRYLMTPQRKQLTDHVRHHITLNAALNSKVGDPSVDPYTLSPTGALQAFLIEENGRVTFVGNRTECALLMLIREWGEKYQEIRQQYEDDMIKVKDMCAAFARPPAMGSQVYGFSSAKKMASVIVRDRGVMKILNKVWQMVGTLLSCCIGVCRVRQKWFWTCVRITSMKWEKSRR